MPINSKTKGKVGELEIAKLLREKYGYQDARRGVQYKGGEDSPDVMGVDGLHIEVKRVEKLNIEDAMQQSIRDSGENEVPVVFHRKNKEKWKATLLLDDFMKLWGKQK
jgi:hypothetical protein